MGLAKSRRGLIAPSFTGDGSISRIAHFKYNFAVDGGVIGAITPASTTTLPNNAIILGGQIWVSAAVTSAGAATVSVGTTAGSSATSLLGATAKTSLTLNAVFAPVPTEAAAIRMSAAGAINITVGTAALTAGVIEGWIRYVVPA
jgi:hypothetical protein